MKKLLTLALALVALALFSGSSVAQQELAREKIPVVPCFCKAIQDVGSTAGTSIPNPLIDFGVVATYPTAIGYDGHCLNACSQAAATNANFNNKTWWCQLKKVKGHHRVSAYASLGVKNTYRVAQSIEFDCAGGDTTCQCPKGWVCNGCDPQVDGGWTSDGKCKQAACGPNHFPPPPNWTLIGDWGFTWGNYFYAWGTSANGGAPGNCRTTPWEGH